MGTKGGGAADRDDNVAERTLGTASSWLELERGRLGGCEPERFELPSDW